MNAQNYRHSLAPKLLGILAIEWLLLAVALLGVCGMKVALWTPLLPFHYVAEFKQRPFHFLNLAIVFFFLAGMMAPFIRRQWARVAYVTPGVMLVYFAWCGFLIWALSPL